MTIQHGDTYKGWRVTYSDDRPATGKWRAERFGVGMCSGTSTGLQSMIDSKIRYEAAQRKDNMP
jgi:hypothetical protein